MDTIERFRGCLLGLAVGDAVGTAVEFSPRGTFKPITDMVGGGPFGLKPGEWTDDTSMALCLATSLVECGGFDPRDQLERYWNWYRRGYLSSNGRCFDIGGTTRQALHRFKDSGEVFSSSTDTYSAGNGCIMRLAPVALLYFPDQAQIHHYSAESARTTHGAMECLDACRLMGDILFQALSGKSKEEMLFTTSLELLKSERIKEIARGVYRDKPESDIQGSGYVVESLKAALWSFKQTNSFEEAILKATNLGDDADTTAAVCGQVAGAFYGERGIAERWLERLVMHDEISKLAEKLYAAPEQCQG